jgi:hypothetical protein
MITFIYRVFTVSFRAFNVGFGRIFSRAFAAGYGVFITSRNVIVFLTFIVTCYFFFRKKRTYILIFFSWTRPCEIMRFTVSEFAVLRINELYRFFGNCLFYPRDTRDFEARVKLKVLVA